VSCSTVSDAERNEIVSTAISLADRYCSLGDYDQALKIYAKANRKCKDWRFEYNSAVIQEHIGNKEEAFSSCLKSYEKTKNLQFLSFARKIAQDNNWYEKLAEVLTIYITAEPDKKQHSIDLIKTIKEYDQSKAYQLVCDHWNNGNHNLDTAALLYQLNPQEWKEVYIALGGTISDED